MVLQLMYRLDANCYFILPKAIVLNCIDTP